MIHTNYCDCVNCAAKGSPIRQIYLSTVTPEELSAIEVHDWLEGYGMVISLAEQKYIRRYGFLLLKQRVIINTNVPEYLKEIERLKKDDPQWDATDAAHPAFWRGEKYGTWEATRLIADVLSGKNDRTGRMNEPVETMRDSVFKLKQERDELRKIAGGAICEAIELENERRKLEEKCKEVQERNDTQAKVILEYQMTNNRFNDDILMLRSKLRKATGGSDV